jgi:membrane-bound acyltransferase YfiQ involved in biofilm formation
MTTTNEYQNFSHFRPIFVTMKSVLIFGLLVLSFLSRAASAQEQQVVVPYTLADRDRAILTEATVRSLDAGFISVESKLNAVETRLDRIEVKFESQQRQLDSLVTQFYWGFGILISLFLFMFGYMIWDRRTAMKPALIQASKAMDDNRSFLTVLRDYSKKHPDLAEIMRTHGML